MKKIRAILASLAMGSAAVLSATAVNADGYSRNSVKDAPQYFSWTGFYLGGHAGLVTGNTTGDPGLGGPLSTDYSLNGALYGGQIGYNWQTGSTVLGVEGSFSGANIQGTTSCVAILECKRDIDWLATVVGRAGIAMDRSLLYAMAGVAWADVSTNVSIVGIPLLSGSETHVGWVAGFGFEHAFTNRVSTSNRVLPRRSRQPGYRSLARGRRRRGHRQSECPAGHHQARRQLQAQLKLS